MMISIEEADTMRKQSHSSSDSFDHADSPKPANHFDPVVDTLPSNVRLDETDFFAGSGLLLFELSAPMLGPGKVSPITYFEIVFSKASHQTWEGARVPWPESGKVFRRYSEVEQLRKYLIHRYGHIVIPPLRSKSSKEYAQSLWSNAGISKWVSAVTTSASAAVNGDQPPSDSLNEEPSVTGDELSRRLKFFFNELGRLSEIVLVDEVFLLFMTASRSTTDMPQIVPSASASATASSVRLGSPASVPRARAPSSSAPLIDAVMTRVIQERETLTLKEMADDVGAKHKTMAGSVWSSMSGVFSSRVDSERDARVREAMNSNSLVKSCRFELQRAQRRSSVVKEFATQFNEMIESIRQVMGSQADLSAAFEILGQRQLDASLLGEHEEHCDEHPWQRTVLAVDLGRAQNFNASAVGAQHKMVETSLINLANRVRLESHYTSSEEEQLQMMLCRLAKHCHYAANSAPEPMQKAMEHKRYQERLQQNIKVQRKRFTAVVDQSRQYLGRIMGRGWEAAINEMQQRMESFDDLPQLWHRHHHA